MTNSRAIVSVLAAGRRAAPLLLGLALLSGCSSHNDEVPTPQAAAAADLTNNLGNGVNLQPSYYNNGNPNFAWSLMKQQTKIKTLRIEIDPSRVGASTAANWISQARSNGYTNLICTYHYYGGSDKASDLMTAANWWKANYRALGGNFTINLCNEWGSHNITPSAYAAAYNSAISTVRQVYSGPIVVDIPGYGQETATAAAAVKGTGGTKINDTNIILSVHVYPNGYNQAKGHNLQSADLDDLGSAGRPCIVGEFGNTPSGSVDWQGVVNHAKSKGWTVLGWAWNGDGLGMNMVSPAWSSNATATSFTLSSYFSTVYNLL
ncbi:cellulase family glycosylhydrolase [Hymenobacter caeli]|uniref:Glycoside hydrolase family 5 domain-containing protein n=1 Tax=Hymenobacter caeli TaxID=2735894 RepID=A0ABX2FUM8_9BACT|nr:cellulase family glycosylhydrolase [Hymenobacter caeli]NRT20892.1 hypothetical protein [Hymenobacter caeli]